MKGGSLVGGALILQLGIGQVGLHDAFFFAVSDDEFACIAEKTVELVWVVDEHVACGGAEE